MKFFSSKSSPNDEVEVWPEMPEQAVHTSAHPFCFDMTCPCHTNDEAVQQLADDVRDGLASGADALRIWRGKTV